MRKLILILLLSFAACSVSYAGEDTIKKKTAGMKKYEGYFTFYWDVKNGKIWLEVNKLEKEFLYVNSLPAGLGSNDIGLDRNQLGNTKIVKFLRIGPKLLLIQPNYSFRALSDNPDERKAVEDAFGTSVIWGFKIEAEENGRVLVDASSFLLRDAHGVTGTLKYSRQGNYKLDNSRSAFYLPGTKNFPQNTEFEAILTFTGNDPGRFVRSVAPDAKSITIRQHHSLIKLPDDNYKPRSYDPRSSYFGISYLDFATPVDEQIRKRYIARHRLNKKDPSAKVSDPVKPLIYYVDRGAPEPIMSALIEGAKWWNEAFEAIGYRNAFQVKVLPEGADPMDIRYNVINWVHRSTRGWSYGSAVTDPRTGEIIKGHISLGSLRVRQDLLIAEGLAADFEDGKKVSADMKEMALARIRQLSCHEIGHTIGLNHNYSSSAENRSSVMDYPHPLIKIKNDGTLDLSDAYDTGMGEWDKVSIAYGYQDFPGGTNEEKELKSILNEAFERGLTYLTDQDARPAGSVHPLAHLWDNGKHPVDELERVMKIRSIALNKFSLNKLRNGTPVALLEEIFVPVYLFHRYQIEASSKVLAGVYYNHVLKGGKQEIMKIVPAEEQRRALDALLEVIMPENLAVDEKILNLLPPRPPGYGRSPEVFQGYTGMMFDPLAAAGNIVDMTLKYVLNPQRAARLVDYHSREKKLPGLIEVTDKIISQTWKSSDKPGYYSEIQRVVNYAVLNHLMRLAANKNASMQVKAVISMQINNLKIWIEKQLKTEKSREKSAQFFYAVDLITRFQKDPDKFYIPESLNPPNGSPIGAQK